MTQPAAKSSFFTKQMMSAIAHNILVGLAVSIVMLNLGAAMGLLSGRGAFAGMLSAGIIAFITSAFGGTRIQGSGTTAPMSTLTAVVVAFAIEKMPAEVQGLSADQFVNIVILMSAAIMVILGVTKSGWLIGYVPKLVISGFMCGIALIIWILQIEILFGLGGRTAIAGNMGANLAIAVAALGVAFIAPILLKKISVKLSSFVPGTLVALILVSAVSSFLQLDVAHLIIDNPMSSMGDFTAFVKSQIPTTFNFDIFMLALPFALQLAALCYIDTLLTSLIIDKMRGEKTRQNKELMSQGLSSGLVGLVGGVPGAQSTVPSVLTVKEGATMRLAGMAAGVFIILEMLLLADIMQHIPMAVFAGILFKVGFDVFDFKPFAAYVRTLRKKQGNKKQKIMRNREMLFLAGTAILTAFIDLIAAVFVFTIGFHFVNAYLIRKKKRMNDYVPN